MDLRVQRRLDLLLFARNPVQHGGLLRGLPSSDGPLTPTTSPNPNAGGNSMRFSIPEFLNRPVDRRSALAGIVLPAAAYMAARTLWQDEAPAPSPLTTVPVAREGELKELVAIVISASFCHGNAFPGLSDALHELPWLIQSHAADEGLPHRLVGVAIDPLAARGASYMNGIGQFHELVVGGGWTNAFSLKYMWQDGRLPASVPQVLVLERTMHATSDVITLVHERFLRHLDSPPAIVEWIGQGAPVTPLAPLA